MELLFTCAGLLLVVFLFLILRRNKNSDRANVLSTRRDNYAGQNGYEGQNGGNPDWHRSTQNSGHGLNEGWLGGATDHNYGVSGESDKFDLR